MQENCLKKTVFGSIIGHQCPEGSLNMAKPNSVVKQIRNATRRTFTAEDKIRIVLEGLRGRNKHLGIGQKGGHRIQRLLQMVQKLPGGRKEMA